MIYIESPSTDPHFNLALEQYVFDDMDKNQEYFMLWQNNNAIIIGKHQNTISEINQEYVKETGIQVVRRLSGGGAMYQDMGNLNFTFIVDDGKNLSNFDFSKFCTPIVKALAKLNVTAEINGRNDITIDGKKFSGNAQYTKHNRIMHHGTILYNSDTSVVAKSLKVSRDKIESKGIKSVQSRVTNVKDYMKQDIPLFEFKKLLLQYMFEDGSLKEYKLTKEDIQKIKKIQKERYDTWEWNYGFSPKYNIIKERRFEGCGKLELFMEVQDGIIKEFNVFGDYFGNGDKTDLINALVGKKVESGEIEKAIEKLDINFYFNNMSKKDFIDLILL